MLSPIAYGLAVVLDLLILFIGYRFLTQPRAAAAGYGVPAEHGDAAVYLTIKGWRDLTYGVMGLALLFFVGARAEAWFMLVAAIMPFADTVIVLRNGGAKAVAFGVHFATAVAVLISSALLFLV
ncbi:DUF4267 domain-containing protein [Nonomuraea rhodomycinica]|uniref:DUF4267 domain-containing protein n=1 Tax=Nonomuraea rhodomycinica TaxID=1712872 RepID=A0A7Y6IVZ0_9ACTN|nr:DUF4267 domain-containing protein [Nonomuraea rhodomycinica]NUW44828.1 DUF4267 domain-containing protein [Nonomuraea rhodomycinica]